MNDLGMPEDERRARVRGLVEEAPDGVDVERLLGGSLAPLTRTEPPVVPVWSYPDYIAAHPGVTLDQLGPRRFPFRSARGHTALTSLDELLEPGPGPAAVRPTRRDVVALYAALHEAGLLAWEPATHTVVQVDDPSVDVAAIVTAWREQVVRGS